jgi:hypothetical protein
MDNVGMACLGRKSKDLRVTLCVLSASNVRLCHLIKTWRR